MTDYTRTSFEPQKSKVLEFLTKFRFALQGGILGIAAAGLLLRSSSFDINTVDGLGFLFGAALVVFFLIFTRSRNQTF